MELGDHERQEEEGEGAEDFIHPGLSGPLFIRPTLRLSSNPSEVPLTVTWRNSQDPPDQTLDESPQNLDPRSSNLNSDNLARLHEEQSRCPCILITLSSLKLCVAFPSFVLGKMK